MKNCCVFAPPHIVTTPNASALASHEITLHPPRSTHLRFSLWSITAKNTDKSTGPLHRPFARLLAPITRSLASDCSLCSRPLLCSLIRSLAHSLARGTVNDWMAILSVFFSIFDHSGSGFINPGLLACSFIRSLAHLFTRLLIRSLAHSFVRTLAHSFARSFVRLLTLLTRSLIRSLACSRRSLQSSWESRNFDFSKSGCSAP